MPYSKSLRSIYNAPPLSAIVHGSNPVSTEDGFCLPSSFHDRTWLLDTFQETVNETASCQQTNCKQENLYTQGAFFPRVVKTTTNSTCCERTTCQSEGASATLECVSPACQLGSNQQIGCRVWSCQPESYLTRNCPSKTYMSKSCQTLECESHQYQIQNPESSGCPPLVYVSSGPQLLESSSSTYEPTCCVTGGWHLSSK
ncbi:keratin-associated protein 27-1 [Dasypus novemcinctus]|uniref:keratin-associated protein 27-1 n=1 Tax=Dasypus novemcinctus TaxID=9361 RepID=UPI0000E369D3|nr:keratin-associated protein 27-1 [Dasypus novemcinctus]